MLTQPENDSERRAAKLVLAESHGLCELGKVCPDCDCFPVGRDAYARERAEQEQDA